MARKFKKKPVEIEAMQWDGTLESYLKICEWIGTEKAKTLCSWNAPTSLTWPTVPVFRLRTLESENGSWFIVSHWDFVIRGIKGEYYACKPDIFAATYEAV